MTLSLMTTYDLLSTHKLAATFDKNVCDSLTSTSSQCDVTNDLAFQVQVELQ
jgi:hypothetical protein